MPHISGSIRKRAGPIFPRPKSVASGRSYVQFPHPRRPPLSKYLLKLFITGTNPRTELAIANLRRICETELAGQYSLEIIDVIENPEAAEQDRILATPTLIKQLPPPLRRVIGDLSDRDKVLFGLNVQPADKTPPSAKSES